MTKPRTLVFVVCIAILSAVAGYRYAGERQLYCPDYKNCYTAPWLYAQYVASSQSHNEFTKEMLQPPGEYTMQFSGGDGSTVRLRSMWSVELSPDYTCKSLDPGILCTAPPHEILFDSDDEGSSTMPVPHIPHL